MEGGYENPRITKAQPFTDDIGDFGYVYLITNKLLVKSTRKYFMQNVNQREERKPLSQIGRSIMGLRTQNDISRYGKDNFSREILSPRNSGKVTTKRQNNYFKQCLMNHLTMEHRCIIIAIS